MRILATFPGKHGDLIWAMPSLRALSEATGAPIDLAVAAESASICSLLEAQPYIGKAFALADWIGLAEPHMPWQAPRVEGYDAQVDLGYRGWPDQPLAQYTFARLRAEACWAGVKESALELGRPWLTVKEPLVANRFRVIFGWSDEHFELKFGLTALIEADEDEVILAPHSRWQSEAVPVWQAQGMAPIADDWIGAAQTILQGQVFLGCCSALHVLACGLGVPVVMMEPSPARHNDIFYPLGKQGPQVTLVLGNTGEPTWDARAVSAAVRQALEAQR